MGRPPSSGGPAFRFTQNEVVEMEAWLQEVNNSIPSRETICALAEKFSLSPDRVGKFVVQPKQVWNWFQNRRYSQKAKVGKAPGKLSISPLPREDSSQFRNVAPPISTPAGHKSHWWIFAKENVMVRAVRLWWMRGANAYTSQRDLCQGANVRQSCW